MEVFMVTAYYKAPHGMSVVNMVAACPTGKSCSDSSLLKSLKVL